MSLLRMRQACFEDAAHGVIGPLTLAVAPGERHAFVARGTREAAIVARMAAGIVKASSGSVLVNQYDPRIQAAQCKRAAALVPHDALSAQECEFERYVLYRAALAGIDPMQAMAHARLLLERLEGVHEAFAFPLVGALIAAPKLVVLDRPQSAYAAQILAAIGPRAIFSTHLGGASAQAFASPQRDVAPLVFAQ